MQYITDVIEAMSILLFCGFVAIFIIPKLFFWFFYTIPQVIRFSAKKVIHFSAMVPIVKRIVAWLLIICLLYAIAFFIDASTGLALIFSPTAIASWILAAANILWTSFVSRKKIQDEFYNNIYLAYITDTQKLKYDEYIENAGKFTYTQALSEQEKKLNYLQKKAVSNRIKFLLASEDLTVENMPSHVR